jgi:hypothetical protein
MRPTVVRPFRRPHGPAASFPEKVRASGIGQSDSQEFAD